MKTKVTTLALDAGQTGIRSQLLNGAESSEASFPGLRTDLELFPQLLQIIQNQIEFTSGPVQLAIGMTGLTKSETKPEQFLESLDQKVVSVHLAHDSVSGFLGSLGLNQGTVTAVGTGVVALAVGAKQMARVDGWGNLIGDAGSAYWVGRGALEAAMRSYDGRIPKTKLEALLGNFSHPEEAYIELQTNDNRVSVIASFAKTVMELAETDVTAKNIVQLAGAELALSAVTATRKAGLLDEASTRFSWAGNMMRADLLKNSFIDAVRQSVPNASFHEPIAKPINGVALLPTISADSPLRQVIYSAERVAINS
jgi:N-acetylglucosamine kinase-like BadF-type ATPase